MGLTSKPLGKVRPDVPTAEVVSEKVGRVNINVPVSVRTRWKIVAAQANRPMSDMIVEAMNTYIETHK